MAVNQDDDNVSLPSCQDPADYDSEADVSLPSLPSDDDGMAAEEPQDDIAEFYSPPRVVPVANQYGLKGALSLDITTGCDFLVEERRDTSIKYLLEPGVRVLLLSPPCQVFSVLQELWNLKRAEPVAWAKKWKIGMALLEHACMAAQTQIDTNNFFVLEHPVNATSWRQPIVKDLMNQKSVKSVVFDQCCFGAKTKVAGKPVRKRTRLLTNSEVVLSLFKNRICKVGHIHQHLQGREGGSRRTEWAQIYPAPLCAAFAQCAYQHASSSCAI